MNNEIGHHPLTDANPQVVGSHPTASLHQFYCSAWCSIVGNIPLAIWGQLSCLWPTTPSGGPHLFTDRTAWKHFGKVLLDHNKNISVSPALFPS